MRVALAARKTAQEVPAARAFRQLPQRSPTPAEISGGNGGAGSTNGAGGAGIIGSNLTINQSAGGSISGGLSGDGVTRADAITLTGGANTISFGGPTSGLTGNIAVTTGSLNINQATDVMVSNSITGAGTVDKSGAGVLTLSGVSNYTGGTTVDAGGLTIANTGSLVSSITNNATLTNNGTIAGTVHSSQTFDNTGTGTVTGTVTITGGFAFNSGTWDGGLNNSGLGTSNSGTVNHGLTNSGGYTQSGGSTNGGTTNTGTIDATGGAFNGAISNNGIFDVVGTVTSNSTFDNSTATARLLVDTGSYTVSGSITNSGSDGAGGIAVAAGAILNANGGVSNNAGATFANAGTTNGGVTNAGGTFTNSGAVNGTLTNSGGTFNNSLGTVTGASTVSGGAVTNTGAFDSTLGVSGGTFQNNTGGIVTGLTSITGGTVTNTGGSFGAVNNSGTATFDNTTGSAGAVTNSATGTNGGTIASLTNTGGTFGNAGNVTGASTVSGGAVTNTGAFQSTLGVSGGTFQNNTGGFVTGLTSITGGTVTNTGGSFGDVSNSGTGTFNNNSGTAGAVTNSATGTNGSTIASLTNTGGTFGNAGNVTGASTVSGGAVTNTGAFQSTLGVSGGTFQNNTGGFVTGLTSITGGTVTNSGGLFGDVSNSGTGTFNNNNGTAGAVTNSATGTNGGTIASLSNTGGTFTNNGKITGVATVTGGTLTGTGSITAATTIASGGTFAPGNSTAGSSMSITGDLAFQSGAIYLVQVNPATAAFAGVSGTATLGGATVNASFAQGSYVAKQYTILTAASGVKGSFDGPVDTNLPSGFHTSLSTDQDNAYLNLALSFMPPPNSGLTANQQNVGNAIVGFFNADGGIPMVFGGLTPAGLTQASGETAVGTQQTTFDAMTQFMGVMTDPFVAGRGDGGSLPGGATGYADEPALGYAQARKPNDALAAIYSKAPPSVPFEARWSVWAAGFGGSQTTDGSAATGSNNTTSRVFGTAVGADYLFSPDTLAGFALAGGGTNFSVANGGSGHSDLFQAGAFVRHTMGAAYISAALAYGWQDVTTDRTVTVAGADMVRARFDANAYSGRVEGGYRFVTPLIGGGITPYAAGQFTTFDLPAYSEGVLSGANTFALAYGAKSVTDTRSELGLRTDKSFALSNAILTLRGRAAWAHDYDPDRAIGATFQALPGASFVVNGAAQASNSALVTASAETKWINGWSVAATFEGEFSEVTRSYAGKGVVRYAW